jgi:hypothetical protein
MAINLRRYQPAVGKTWHGHVLGFGRETSDGFFAIPKGLDLMTQQVQSTTAVAMRQVLWAVVLKSFHVFSNSE